MHGVGSLLERKKNLGKAAGPADYFFFWKHSMQIATILAF